ncbi:hypothetical protein TSTA_078830 [Talaromyces stipitatus ATCC 10500]|uniref:F-box domain-containing protein n=1 Tax=Talaromyces stipitatus (strain ATCC 10500 / CBS 375.48 / QM 6759 / NRRL 1006) TaxID=441959 RepID=B8LXM7_TALSN|nr:uncharacterized protein TSTA_078830 [Talaromyces stipitatus ATCC 10500]EED24528.1 hypothetical protein TSTA_078830 [Talaromyces stipitatus ATCC 10500]
MSFRVFSCAVCGRPFYEYDDPNPKTWLKNFRILFSGPNGVSVSGVGQHNELFLGYFSAHWEYTTRWDNPNTGALDGPIGVLTQSPISNRHGFLFHEACWSLLEKIYQPKPIPWSRLYDVCKSMPLSKRGAVNISWGHDYGGLLLSDNESFYPWQRRVFNMSVDRKLRLSASMDPMCGSNIEQLLHEQPQGIPFMDKDHPTAQVKRSVDVFSRLPPEIRDIIAYSLSVRDAANLRLASRSFFSVFANQQFWASRFSPDSDRSWLFELWNKRGYKAWRWLYRRTDDACLSPALRNRKRVWKLLEHLRDIVDLQWKENSQASISHVDIPGLKYRKITADVRLETPSDTRHYFDEGCRLLRQQNVTIPPQLSQVAVSTVQVGDIDYVSGMRFVSSEGTVTEFGYWSGKKIYSTDVTSLEGFNVATGTRGIQAIQILDEKEHTSQWLGSRDECPKTRYLVVSKPIRTIEAGFDACKMISLAVEYEDLGPIDRSIEQTKSLRDVGYWYPEVPGRDLYLNEYSNVVDTCYPDEHRPLCWISFGGPGGIYLKYVKGMTITFRGDILRCVEFIYEGIDIPIRNRRVGRRALRGYDKVFYFPIDGPGGEIIDAVEVMLANVDENEVHDSFRNPVLKAFRVLTNRGRRHLQPPLSFVYDELKVIKIAPGTTITGFYVGQHPSLGLTSLGVISEVVKR